MPTPAWTPGAQLIPLAFSAPSFMGLNTEMGGGILPQGWASKLENAVFDESGRPASRKGWNSVTSVAGSGTIMRIFEYYKADSTSEVFASTDSDIYDGVTGTMSSIKGSLSISDGNIKFVNFNDKCIAFGIGTAGLPAVSTGGAFADITVNSQTTADSSDPAGTIGTSAFGRLWVADPNGKTLRYSALLDETRWADADGGGSIDYSKVWPSGQDDIVAVTEFGGDLVVFGSNNTVVMTDGQGSSLGIDPTALYVSDTLPGVGALSQFAMTRAAGDFWFLSPFGIVALERELVQKSTPFQNISKNVQSGVTGASDAVSNKDDITLTYNPHLSLVLAIFPDVDTMYCFDTRQALEDGAYRATSWESSLQTAEYVRGVENWYGSLSATAGEVMQYNGNDDDGTNYFFDYESGWLDLGQEMNSYLKFVKRMTSFTFITQNVTVTHKVKYDFNSNSYTFDNSVPATSKAEYNAWNAVVDGSAQAEYNSFTSPVSTVAEYGGGVALRTLDAHPGGGGQYIKIGLRLNTLAGSFVLQQINLHAKIGRLAS
jgi:hypothetical protein